MITKEIKRINPSLHVRSLACQGKYPLGVSILSDYRRYSAIKQRAEIQKFGHSDLLLCSNLGVIAQRYYYLFFPITINIRVVFLSFVSACILASLRVKSMEKSLDYCPVKLIITEKAISPI